MDDEELVRATIGATLEHCGYEARLAVSGREAMEILEGNAFDLILTDVAMQDGNGISLLERIQKEQSYPPLVMVNTFRDIRVAIDSMRRGAFDHLLKPFERDYLLNAVDRALEHRQARREMHNYQHSLEQLVKARTSAMTVTASAMANESAPLLQSQP